MMKKMWFALFLCSLLLVFGGAGVALAGYGSHLGYFNVWVGGVQIIDEEGNPVAVDPIPIQAGQFVDVVFTFSVAKDNHSFQGASPWAITLDDGGVELDSGEFPEPDINGNYDYEVAEVVTIPVETSTGPHTIDIWSADTYKEEYWKDAIHTESISVDIEVSEPGSVIEAALSIHPRIINLRIKVGYLLCCISLPDGYDVADIDVDSVMLEDEIPALRGTVLRNVLWLRFSRRAVIAYLKSVLDVSPPVRVTLTVSGFVGDAVFEGNDSVCVIKWPK